MAFLFIANVFHENCYGIKKGSGEIKKGIEDIIIIHETSEIKLL